MAFDFDLRLLVTLGSDGCEASPICRVDRDLAGADPSAGNAYHDQCVSRAYVLHIQNVKSAVC